MAIYKSLGRNSPRWEVEDKRKCYGRGSASRRILEWHLLITEAPWRSGIGELVAGRFSNVLTAHAPPSILLARWIMIHNEDRREVEVAFWATRRTASGAQAFEAPLGGRKPHHSLVPPHVTRPQLGPSRSPVAVLVGMHVQRNRVTIQRFDGLVAMGTGGHQRVSR